MLIESSQLTSVDALLSNSMCPPQVSFACNKCIKLEWTVLNIHLFSRNNETPSKFFLINYVQSNNHYARCCIPICNQHWIMIENHINLLVQKEIDTPLQKSGLSNKMHIFRSSTTELRLSKQLDTSPAMLSECFKAFFDLVLGSEGSLPEFE